MNRFTYIAAAALVACAASLAVAKDKAPSLDDLLNIPVKEKPAKPAPAPATTPDGKPNIVVPDDDKPAGGDAFALAVKDMKTASQQLSVDGDTSLTTQRVQERVIRRLDQQIADMRKRQQQQQQKQQQQQQQDTGSAQNQQKQQGQQKAQRNSNASESADRAGQKGEVKNGELGDEPLTENLSEWGNLPPKLRKQLLQGWEDNFSQLYRDLTERYYRRLAEEGR